MNIINLLQLTPGLETHWLDACLKEKCTIVTAEDQAIFLRLILSPIILGMGLQWGS